LSCHAYSYFYTYFKAKDPGFVFDKTAQSDAVRFAQQTTGFGGQILKNSTVCMSFSYANVTSSGGGETKEYSYSLLANPTPDNHYWLSTRFWANAFENSTQPAYDSQAKAQSLRVANLQ